MSKLTVYTKDFCGYCVMAKRQLTAMNIEFEEVNIELDTEIRTWLIEQGHRTMPQIYWKGELFVENGAQGLEKLTEDQIRTKMGEIDFDVSFKL